VAARTTAPRQLRHWVQCTFELAIHSCPLLPAEAGCETWERMVLKLAFISLQQHSNKGSLEVTPVGVLPHVSVER